jgi:hypothetical protein
MLVRRFIPLVLQRESRPAGIKKPQGIERTCGLNDYLVMQIRLCQQEARSNFSWLPRYA